jgi:hypothetical protein
MRVRVQVAKLDTGSGVVGVAIERSRPHAHAQAGAAPRLLGAERPD